MESWEKDLGTYPEHFQDKVRAALGQPKSQPKSEAPPEAELFYSEIRPVPAELQIQNYLEQVTPPDAHRHKFKFESLIFGIALGAGVLGFVIFVFVLGGVGS